MNDANELLENQYRQVQAVTEDLHALQDAMHLKDMEIERLQRDANELAAMQSMRPGLSGLGSAYEATKPSLEINGNEGPQGSMGLNIEL